MSKVTYLKIAVGLLILVNLVLVGFMMITPPPTAPPREFIIEKLNFEGIQIEDYDNLIATHKLKYKELQHNILETKTALYQLLNQEDQVELEESLINEISLLQKESERLNLSHFQEIKKLCKGEEQLKAFDMLVLELADLFDSQKRGPHKKRRK